MEISIRKWGEDDIETFADIVNHTNRKYLMSMGKGTYTLDMAREYIDFATNKAKGLFRAIEYNGKVVGSISIEQGEGMLAIDGRISYFLKETYQGNGIMTMAVGLIVKEAFNTTDIQRITAYVASPNIGSIKVLENNYFKREGLLRKASVIDNEFSDVAIYALLKEESRR